MTAATHRTRRTGATTVEAALVLPVMFALLLGMAVIGTGLFYHQMVACQAREAARWASVRGADYQKDIDADSPTAQQVAEQAVLPMAAGMDPAALTVQAVWVDKGAGGGDRDWDTAPKDVRSVTAGGEYVSNAVRVTVTYRWAPGAFLDPVVIGSSSEWPMSY